ncbi:MAG: hypothetical protein A2161_05850 [Candidatus Schekmanbacteria bacterium RBG_13_48_7]|uniref:Molybdenum cofactor biosynthesis protein A-like twitch domain-containing protein n=1 Tax=Candidatus Schekmanbacteria bacterium RBG_13_48_7 TaxID=1817878 RepID=A0A1F7RTX0_9BACT|nr:MAG: hypothetical protein A2161_05850 [Candidatus Schekmanbacteria bacterium RBG_13_48_7]
MGKLIPLEIDTPSSPAKYYQWEYSGQVLGFISPMTNKFCACCNRLRLTSDGKIKLCLFSNISYDLRELIRNNRCDEIIEMLKSLITKKMINENCNGIATFTQSLHMNQIGG